MPIPDAVREELQKWIPKDAEVLQSWAGHDGDTYYFVARHLVRYNDPYITCVRIFKLSQGVDETGLPQFIWTASVDYRD